MLQFYVEALVDAFHALKLASGPNNHILHNCMQPQDLQDIITFLASFHAPFCKETICSNSGQTTWPHCFGPPLMACLSSCSCTTTRDTTFDDRLVFIGMLQVLHFHDTRIVNPDVRDELLQAIYKLLQSAVGIRICHCPPFVGGLKRAQLQRSSMWAARQALPVLRRDYVRSHPWSYLSVTSLG